MQVDVLDGIRGLAVLLVIFSHLSNAGLVFFPFTLLGEGSGQIGVFLFFVLSAFLLTRNLVEKGKAGGLNLPLWRGYFIRRTTRIYPLYSMALLFTLASTAFGWGFFKDMQAGDVLDHLILAAGKAHFWTIAVECKFYLVLPVLIILYFHVFRRHRGLFLAFLVVLALAAMLCSRLGNPSRLSLARSFPVFAMGCAAAMLYSNGASASGFRLFRVGTKGAGRIFYALLGCLFLLMPHVLETAFKILGFQPPSRNFYLPSLFWGAFCALFLLSCLCSQNLPKKILESPPMRLLGTLSFSLYVNHLFVLNWARQVEGSNAVRMVLFYTITLAASSLTYLLIERPLLAWTSGVKRETPAEEESGTDLCWGLFWKETEWLAVVPKAPSG